jgi:hypothetical protein
MRDRMQLGKGSPKYYSIRIQQDYITGATESQSAISSFNEPDIFFCRINTFGSSLKLASIASILALVHG